MANIPENNNNKRLKMLDLRISYNKASAFLSAVAEYLSVPDHGKTRHPLIINHTEAPEGNYVDLLAGVRNLTADRVRVVRAQNTLTIEILGDRADALIYSGTIGHESSASGDEQATLSTQYGNLTWSESSADDIAAYLRSLMSHTRPSEDFWECRSARVIRVIVAALVELRDAGHIRLSLNTFKKHLLLDAIYELRIDDRLMPGTRECLAEVLNDMPGFSIADAKHKRINETCHAHHGYVTMAIFESFKRLLPPPVDFYEYEIRAPFKQVEARLTDRGLLVTIYYHLQGEEIVLGT